VLRLPASQSLVRRAGVSAKAGHAGVKISRGIPPGKKFFNRPWPIFIHPDNYRKESIINLVFNIDMLEIIFDLAF
jgi:hypothetical protein